MSITADALLNALKSSSSPTISSSSTYETEELVVKLAKKNDHAVLSFEMIGLTRVGKKVKIEHDVKVEVMKASDVARLKEPMCPEPNVSADDLRKVLDINVFRSTSFFLHWQNSRQ